MLVFPGLRKLISSKIQQLFNSASFDAPLTHSLVLERGTGSATFTRATTKTWPNNDGYLVTGVSGEIGFVGARRVDNLIRLGAAQSSTLAVAANVTMTLPAGAYQFSMGAGTGRVTFSGTGGATGTLDAVTTGRVHVAKTITAGTLIVTASVATLVDIQVVSMVAETDQTTIREYVSVGVASSPYYHGSMVDGVKCFPTDISGNPIPLTTLLGYSAEGARTNLCLQSQTFGTTWSPNVTTVSSNAAVAPDGTTTADLVYPNSTGVNRYIGQSGLTTTAATWTFSFYAKYAGAGGWAYCIDLTGSSVVAYFDIQNGAVGTVSAGHSASIEDAGNGWYRCSLITTTAPAGAANVYIGNADANGATTITANGTNGIYLWGAQLELGSFASSYISTTTVAVTRNADVLTYSSSGNISGTVGAAYAELGTNWSSPGGQKNALGFSASIDGFINHSGSIATGLRIYDSTNSVEKSSVSTMQNSSVKYAGAWSGSAMSITGGGAAVATGSFDGSIGGTTIAIGCSGAGTSNWDGTIKNVRIWQRALSSSELQAITA